RKALEDCLAALENGKFGLAFSSGMAATETVLKLLRPGDEVITGNDLYGGSYRIFTKLFEPYGIKFHFVDFSNTEIIRNNLNEKTLLSYVETSTNPTILIVVSRAVADLFKEANVFFAVNNSFSFAYLRIPMDVGVNIVFHLVTKFIGGSSDIVMSALVV